MEIILEKVTSSDKWVEFWTKEDVSTGKWTHASKWKYFDEAIIKAGLSDWVNRNGYRGIVVKFYLSGCNWEVESTRLMRGIKLSFSELYDIETRKDEPNREYRYDILYGKELEFIERVAKIYATNYHEEMMSSLKNVDLYL